MREKIQKEQEKQIEKEPNQRTQHVEQLKKTQAALVAQIIDKIFLEEDRDEARTVALKDPELFTHNLMTMLITPLRAQELKVIAEEDEGYLRCIKGILGEVGGLERVNREIAQLASSDSAEAQRVDRRASPACHGPKVMELVDVMIAIENTGFGSGDVQMNLFKHAKYVQIGRPKDGDPKMTPILTELKRILHGLQSKQWELVRKAYADFAKQKGDRSKVEKAAKIFEAVAQTPVVDRPRIMAGWEANPVKIALAQPRHGANKNKFFDKTSNIIDMEKAAKTYKNILKKLENEDPSFMTYSRYYGIG